MSTHTFTVAALYKFIDLPNFEELQKPLLEVCTQNDIKGTLLLAREGVNGTIAGSRTGIDNTITALYKLIGTNALEYKESFAETQPFHRMKVRLKREIVTMGVPSIDPNCTVGTYIEPENWNALITSDDVMIIDTRNDYEVGIGTFKGAINPKTTTFREFPAWFENFCKTTHITKNTRFAMFCTGGIRCEKSTSYLKQQGYNNVYHLKGGILKYLETIPAQDSLWQGECFVFDGRVSVKHGLELGAYDQCFACRNPITDEDKASPLYEKGVSCPKCHEHYSTERKKRFEERQKQIELAEKRGLEHIGADTTALKALKDAKREEERNKALENAQ